MRFVFNVPREFVKITKHQVVEHQFFLSILVQLFYEKWTKNSNGRPKIPVLVIELKYGVEYEHR